MGLTAALSVLPLVRSLYALDEVGTLLETPAVSYAQAARFVLEAADAASLASPEAAFDYAQERRWLPASAQAGEPARLMDLSLLVMRSFDFKGGLFYTLFKNPHYAYRELVYRRVILGKTDPHQTVSGEYLLVMVGRALDLTDEEKVLAQAMEEERRREEIRAAEEARGAEEVRALAEAERLRALEEARRQAERERMAEEINAQLQTMRVEDTTAAATGEGITISLSNIIFAADSAVLIPSEQRKVREIAEILRTVPGRKLLITGHTALAGSAAGQMTVSQQRAQAVADYLVSLGARRAEEITVQGYGATRPVADNANPAGQARNRRVEITILEDQP
jgi:outer membrane protein OmpA-like peptidoglycan-associated protein